MVFQAANRYDSALSFFFRAAVKARETDNHEVVATAMNNMGGVYILQGDYERAKRLVETSLMFLRATGNRHEEGIGLQNLGIVFQEEGKLAKALLFYRQSIDVQEDIRSSQSLEETKTSLAGQAVGVFERAILLSLQLGQPKEAFNLAERARSRSFLDQLGNTLPDVTRGADPELVKELQDLQNELDAAELDMRQELAKPISERKSVLVRSLRSQLDEKEQAYNEVLNQLKLQSPEYASLVTVEASTLLEVQAQLVPGQSLLSYYVTPEVTIAFVVRRDDFEVVQLKIREEELSRLITAYRKFPNTQAEYVERTRQPLADLFTQLIQPLQDRGLLSSQETGLLTVVPHGVLHYLPFTALWDEESKAYLGETYSLTSLPSASVLRFVKAKDNPNNQRLLAMANAAAEGFPTLSHAADEVREVAALYNTSPLINRDAHKKALFTNAPGQDVVFLAAHGELNNTSPLFSRILLAADSERDDGSLTVEEVYNLNLRQANLVVLSACQTSLGELSRGDDLVGLNRAFIYAGTPSVMASLWNVDDKATKILISSFFKNLKAGMTQAQALQKAQAEVRSYPEYAHPFFWSAFVLTGEG